MLICQVFCGGLHGVNSSQLAPPENEESEERHDKRVYDSPYNERRALKG